MKKYLVLIVVVLAVSAVVYATHRARSSEPVKQQVTQTKAPEPATGAVEQVADVKRAKGFDIPYEPAKAKASVAAYTVKPDLSNVANSAQFGAFTPQQKALLAKNAFFGAPTTEQQLFFIYEQNDYKNIPSFITTDSVLQVYHIFYDFTLRNLETEKLHDLCGKLTDAMVKESESVAKQMTDREWKKAADRNRAYFLVASRLMGKKTPLPPGEIGGLVQKEIALVEGHGGRAKSPIFGFEVDYSQFNPRGHYTRSEKLKQYFKAMMWYGYMPFPAYCKWYGEPGYYPWWPELRQGALVTRMLFSAKVDGKPAIETWERIYEPTVFYVGASDDLTPYDYLKALDQVYPRTTTYAGLQDEEKLKQLLEEVKKLPKPEIEVQNMPMGWQLKLMGQRYIPDSEMLQRLVFFPDRLFPKGLDVMAVLGSARAADILDNFYKEPEKWDQYLPNRNKLLKEFNAVPLSTWQSNLYWGWLWGLDGLLDKYGAGYPAFMTNQAWLDKNLVSGLGSWAELRHDTILYAKQSATAECGDGEQPPVPKGYVEPNVEFYNRLLWLTGASKEGLGSRGLLTDEMRGKFEEFEDLLSFLKNVSIKELTGQKLTREEYDEIRLYGANLEMLTLSVIEGRASNWYEITNEADRDMAVIADVHTQADDCLEEGVGHASEIYVVVPIEGKLCLTRGATFSYYEFIHPSSDRLTDEKWQKMLKDKKAKPQPEWTKSFMTGPKKEIPVPKKVRSTGC